MTEISFKSDIKPHAACEIWFIRHGETDWNVAQKMQGSTDIPLNAKGHAQAKALVPSILAAHTSRPFAAVYATPLTRAQQTGAPLAAALGVDLGVANGLQERAFGIIEGEPYETARHGIGRTPSIAAAAQGLFSRDPDYLPPPGANGAAETLRQFYTRVVDTASTIAARHTGERIIIVVHGGVLDCLWRWAHDMSLAAARDWNTLNTSMNVIRVNNDAKDCGSARVLAWGLQAGDALPALDDVG